MLGEFITRCLVLLLGYAYPAFECFKSVEKNRVDTGQLRFWCQYWILVAFLTVFENVGDQFLSWLPMYGEVKLALFIYLWYPKTKGTGYVYEAILRPYFTKHETEIDRKLMEWRAGAWDYAIYYWNNCTELGQAKFFEMLQFLASQSGARLSGVKPSDQAEQPIPSAPMSPAGTNQSGKGKKWPPSPPAFPGVAAAYRAVSDSPKSKVVQVDPHGQTEPVKVDASISNSPGHDRLVEQARLKLRRTKPQK